MLLYLFGGRNLTRSGWPEVPQGIVKPLAPIRGVTSSQIGPSRAAALSQVEIVNLLPSRTQTNTESLTRVMLHRGKGNIESLQDFLTLN